MKIAYPVVIFGNILPKFKTIGGPILGIMLSLTLMACAF
jgi:hypothetical protein